MGNELQKFARNGDEESFHALLQTKPVNLNNLRTLKSGNSVLHTAAKNGNTAIAAELITNQNMDVDMKNSNGYTALHLACMNGKVDTVAELLLLKANRDIAGGAWDSTPLHWACIVGNDKIIKLLLEKGADPNIIDQTGKTPFQFIKDASLRSQFISGSNVHVESTAELEEEQRVERARLDKTNAQQAKIDAAKKLAAEAEKAAASAPSAPEEETTGTPKEKAPESVDEEVEDEVVPQLPKAPESTTKSPKKSTLTFKEGDRIEGKHQGGMRWYPGVIAEVNPDGTYEINYDDGDEESDVIPEYIRLFDGPLPEDSEEEGSEEYYDDSQVRTIER